MEEQLVQRLDRFEKRLDDVVSALQTLARVEERQFMQTDTLNRLWKSVDSIDKRVDDLEENAPSKPINVMLWSALVIFGTVIGFLINVIVRVPT